MATHSIVLAWRIPGTGKPGGLPSMGSHRVGHDCSDSAAAACMYLQLGWVSAAAWAFLWWQRMRAPVSLQHLGFPLQWLLCWCAGFRTCGTGAQKLRLPESMVCVLSSGLRA